jgi:Tfp pilus assembly protein PilF
VAEGKTSEGTGLLGQAADREDATQKHVVTPGPLVPAREALAQTLMAAGQHKEALQAFQSVLDREPNRYRALVGAATAAELLSDNEQAARYRRELTAMAGQADSGRE